MSRKKHTYRQEGLIVGILFIGAAGHPAYGEISAERVDRDSTKWEDTVQPIVGETDILIFPYGSDIHNWKLTPVPDK